MTLKPTLGLLAVLLALPAHAQSENATTATHTVDWYVAHGDERKAEVAKCDNDPGDLQNTPDCVNAKDAGPKAVELEAKQKLDNAGNRIDDAYHDLTK
jgi:hypothetical protein